MKKILALILALTMVMALSACGRPERTEGPSEPTSESTQPSGDGVCEHLFMVEYRTEPTCSKEGSTFSVCKYCAKEHFEIIPALPHSFCEAGCTTARVCTACGITEGNALGHDYLGGICARCGAEMPGYEENPTGCEHAYSLTAQVAPTCTSEGSFTYTCGKCNTAYTETIAAKGHVFSDADCDHPKVCHTCGLTEGSALDHSYIGGVCIRCGAAKEVIYTVTVRSDKGIAIEGVTVMVYNGGVNPAAIGITNSKGVATMTLVWAESYKITLSDVPDGLSAKESYTFSSTRVNINLTTLSQVTPEDHSKANYKVGSTMGDFTLTDTDGNNYTLSQLLREKDLVILNFWFVNCGPCKAEFPYFEQISQKYDNVQLLTLNHMDTVDEIKELRQQMGVTFPMISEDIGMQQGFGLYAYPTTVFISNTGRILKIQVGEFKSAKDLENMIENLL